MHQPQTVTIDIKSGSSFYSHCTDSYKKRSINALSLFKTPHPGTYLGGRAERRPSQKAPLVGLHPHGFARIAAAGGDGRFKNPGMVARE